MTRRGVAKFGVSGWDYADWRGPLYPTPLPRGFRALPLLSRFTQFMEVNVSYYRILPPKVAVRWVEETPPEFTFVFKGWKGWTHERGGLAVSREDSEAIAFRELVAPAADAGRLDGILIQFPPDLRDPREALRRLLPLRDALAPQRIFVEFRHRDLYRDEVFRTLEREQIAFVNVDLPSTRSLPTLTSINTGPVAYLRLHGRHGAGWARGVSRDTRYDYLYSAPEVEELTAVIDDLIGRCPQVLVGANNHFGAQAPAVLAQLQSSVRGVPCAVPPRLRGAFPSVARSTVDLLGGDAQDGVAQDGVAQNGAAQDGDVPPSPPISEMSLDLGPPPRT